MQVVVAYSKITCICVDRFGFAFVVQEFDLIKHPNEGSNRVPFDCNISLESRSRPLDQWGYFYIELGCGRDTKMYKTVILPSVLLKLGPSH